MLIGVLLMVMLWFRPQGMVPERLRKSKFLLPDMATPSGAKVLPSMSTAATAAEAPNAEPAHSIDEEDAR